ncbi:SPFH domain-containing protein [Desulfurococcus mucosus]|uniref:Band 7 protein n=1 Tax=Desulfurococcus mucosus (strain ATCC 35584 / DSM 2162 / JCM 9187 / O7/1) TaxID=765177 RepID=E8R8M3_DESM0|nr:SPFH domain-containing protein [Desulfurococcus mucosus]ADV64849.1 band 7 protein [Desulfurococcus mucosus DSM 2162]
MSRRTNVIEWVNPGPDDILWVYPYEDIRWGSVVVVHEYEAAVFMRDGKIYDVLPPGRHTITTQNIPLLTRAYNLVMGYGETPFKARIVFISLKQFKGRFGTSTRVKLGPRTLYMTELQAYGEYWFRVADPVLFLTQVAGAVPELSTPAVTEFLRGLFTEQFIQELANYTAIDVYTRLTEVTTRIKTGTIYEALKQRGIELIDVKIGGVSLPQLEKMEKEDPTYGLPLLLAIQKGEEDKVLEIIRTVETMRALGRSPGVGVLGALVALPQMLPQTMAPQVQQQPQQPQVQQPQQKSPTDKLRELKKMLDEGLITREEYEQLKKEILEEFKRS